MMGAILGILTTALPLIKKYAVPAIAAFLTERVEDSVNEPGQGKIKKEIVTRLLDEGDTDPEYVNLLADTVEIGVRWMKYRRKQDEK
jgi:hypothetical protein